MADLGTLTITLGVNAQGVLTGEAIITQSINRMKKKAAVLTPALQEPFRLFSKSAVAHLATVSQQFRTIGYLFSAAVTAPIVLATKSKRFL